jgi:NADH/F420H2 dehydrogenase subunit C
MTNSIDATRLQVENLLGGMAQWEMNGKLPAFRVQPDAIHTACTKLREAGFDYLLLMTATDYPAEKRFELVYVLTNFADAQEVALVTNVDRESPQIRTVSDIWQTADWHEREVYDMYGVRFENHPDLRRILLDDTWDGYPLRKDYTDTVHDVVKRPY